MFLFLIQRVIFCLFYLSSINLNLQIYGKGHCVYIGMIHYIFLVMAVLGNVKKIIVSKFIIVMYPFFSKVSYVIRSRVLSL